MSRFPVGTEVTANADGDIFKGKVTRRFVQDGLPMATVELAPDEEHWTGADKLDVPVGCLRLR
jgi:hypothetical protein